MQPDNASHSEGHNSFVAGALFRRLHREPGSMSKDAVGEWFRGAVLFVDISGYTRLAEALCAEGSPGVERLGQTLDRAFHVYVDTVAAYGGEVACFAGDAFIAYWPANGDSNRAAAQATACAARLHDADAAPREKEVPPTELHIGLSRGLVWAARLGNHERWQLLLAGPAVRAACVAAAQAGAGRTMRIDSSTGEEGAIDPLLDDDGSAGTDVLIRIQDGTPAVPFPRRAYAYAGSDAAWVPQWRTIHAVFVRIRGLDESAADALDQHQRLVSSLQRAIRRFTASQGTLVCDDKGLVFTVCFGMPLDALGNDGVRAVRAALAMHAAVARLALGCDVGIAHGSGIYMMLGGSQRRTDWPVGPFMHRAARLMEHAAGRVLCTREVAFGIGLQRFTIVDPGMDLKGIAEPVAVYSPLEAPFADDQHLLFGRDAEQRTLERAFREYRDGTGRLLLIAGEAGIGKSALLQHLARLAADDRYPALLGQAASMETTIAYAPWRIVFAQLLEGGPADVDDNAARLQRLGTLRHPDLAPLVNAVLPGYLPETPLTQGLTGQARADATLTLLTEVLTSRASARFILLLEDCHWMDSASWRLLQRLSQECPQALIVLTSRPGVDPEALAVLKRLPQFEELTLHGLPANAIAALVEHTVERNSLLTALLREVTERSEGNPLYVREYALLKAHQASQPTGEPGTRVAPSAEVMPATVQSLIAGRLDTLNSREELTLKTAAVLGDRFGVTMLAAIHPEWSSPGTFDDILTSLQLQHLIVADGDTGDEYRFEHALIRQVAYEQLTQQQRQHLHRRTAETIEARDFELQIHLGALAHHWSRAGDRTQTVKYSDMAAAQALAAGAFAEAERLLLACTDALRQRDDDVPLVDRIRWHRQLADARHGLGQLDSRSHAAHEALRLAGVPRPAATWKLLGLGGWRFFRFKTGNGRRSPRTEALALDVARAYRHSAEVCYFNNDMLGMICDSISAVECASHLPPSSVLAGAATELGGILSVAGLRRFGERLLGEARDTAIAAGDQAAQAYAHMITALYFVGVGEWREAEASADLCQALCEPMDDRVNWTNAQAVRFWMNHYRSRDTAAFEAACSLRDRASQTGNRQHRAWASRFLALCALRAGRDREAVEHLQSALDCLGEIEALNERIPTLGLLALAQIESGDLDGASESAESAMTKVSRVRRPIGHSTLEGYSALAATALRLGEQDRSARWREHLVTCVDVLRRYTKGFRVGQSRYLLHRGDLERLAGRKASARNNYRRGRAAALQLDMPWDAARCRDALAQLDGSEAPRR